MESLTTIIILLVTAAVSVLAFQRRELGERLVLKPTKILREKQFERLLTSGLIHADWAHLGWNALSFFLFARNIEAVYGAPTLLAIYLAAIFGGSLLSLLIHRNDVAYRALGASGGVCGVIFASIFLLPNSSIHFLLLPMIGIPAYLYAVIFLVTSFIAQRRQTDNIGHDAHLGGAIVGLLVATAWYPRLVFAEPWMFAVVLLLSLGILYVLIRDPARLFDFHLSWGRKPKSSERYQRYDEAMSRREKLEEIDALLDKVSGSGIHSLSNRERQRLDQLSKEVGRK